MSPGLTQSFEGLISGSDSSSRNFLFMLFLLFFLFIKVDLTISTVFKVKDYKKTCMNILHQLGRSKKEGEEGFIVLTLNKKR